MAIDSTHRAVVTGRVTDAHSGAPVDDAVVTFPQWQLSATADSSGRFVVSGVPVGEFVARVERVGYVSRLIGVRVGAGDTTAIPPIALRVAGRTRPPCVRPSRQPGPARALAKPYAFGRPRIVPPGSLVELYVWASADGPHADSAVGAEGTLAGESIAFERQTRGRFVGLGAAPLDSSVDLPFSVTVHYASGASRSVTVGMPLVTRKTLAAKKEQLAVASQFGHEPDAVASARIAAENELARDVAVRSLGTLPLWKERFVRPRPGAVTSGFGMGREFNGAVSGRHLGTDFTGAVGDPVVAANRGVVALVADFYLAGKVVYIDHGGGLVSGYFHLSNTSVAMGDTVARGQKIGDIGQSGRVTGPHLHWSMRLGAIPVDPMSVFAIAPLPGVPPATVCTP